MLPKTEFYSDQQHISFFIIEPCSLEKLMVSALKDVKHLSIKFLNNFFIFI